MELRKIPIDSIVVPPERQRQGLGDDDKKAALSYDQLKESIKSNGLLQPPGVDKDNKLLYGFRRLSAAKDIGWTEIHVVVDPDKTLTPIEREIVELDENLQRFDLSWQERDRALARINKLKRELDPTWTQRKTAVSQGVTQTTVSEAELLMKAMEQFPEIKKAGTRKQALSMAKNQARKVLRKAEIIANPVKYQEVTKKVAIGKAEDLIVTLPDGFTKHIITDGPFGIDYDKRQAAEGVHEAYEDSPESYRLRTAFMAPHMYRVLGDHGFLVWFLAHDHFEWTKQLFSSVGFAVDPVPILWDRSDGRAYTARPDRWLGKAYDIALHCIKGDPQMIVRSRDKGKHGKGNIFRYAPVPVAEKEHIVERPIELYEDLLQCMTLEGEKVVDFFAGSGKVPAACAKLKRDYWACEMNPNHIPTIVNNIYANTPQEVVKVASNGAEQN